MRWKCWKPQSHFWLYRPRWRHRQAILKRFQNPHQMENHWLNSQREHIHQIKKRTEDPPSKAPLFFLLLTSCPPSSTPQRYFYIVTVSFVLWPYFSTGVWVISRRDMVVLHWNRRVRMWDACTLMHCQSTILIILLQHWPLTPNFRFAYMRGCGCHLEVPKCLFLHI